MPTFPEPRTSYGHWRPCTTESIQALTLMASRGQRGHPSGACKAILLPADTEGWYGSLKEIWSTLQIRWASITSARCRRAFHAVRTVRRRVSRGRTRGRVPGGEELAGLIRLVAIEQL